MPFYKLHNIAAYTPVGSTESHYGYTCEVREDGVYADIPEELVEHEKSAGRVREAAEVKEESVEVLQELAPIVDESKAVVVEEVKEEANTEVAAEDKPAKRGRPAKSAE